jgi:hypothetical protein
MVRDHRRQEALIANGGLLPNPEEKRTESDNADCNNDDVGILLSYTDRINASSMTIIGA